jgi:hypothetical protein
MHQQLAREPVTVISGSIYVFWVESMVAGVSVRAGYTLFAYRIP